MKDLHDLGLHGRLPTFIEGFLKNRQFQVKVGSNFLNFVTMKWVFHKAVSYLSLI